MPPLRGLGFCSKTLLHRYHPYGIQEGFEVLKVFAWYPVRLGNRTYRVGGEGGYFFLN